MKTLPNQSNFRTFETQTDKISLYTIVEMSEKCEGSDDPFIRKAVTRELSIQTDPVVERTNCKTISTQHDGPYRKFPAGPDFYEYDGARAKTDGYMTDVHQTYDFYQMTERLKSEQPTQEGKLKQRRKTKTNKSGKGFFSRMKQGGMRKAIGKISISRVGNGYKKVYYDTNGDVVMTYDLAELRPGDQLGEFNVNQEDFVKRDEFDQLMDDVDLDDLWNYQGGGERWADLLDQRDEEKQMLQEHYNRQENNSYETVYEMHQDLGNLYRQRRSNQAGTRRRQESRIDQPDSAVRIFDGSLLQRVKSCTKLLHLMIYLLKYYDILLTILRHL